MCSRNGKPIETLAWPLPSRLSSTCTSVSFVLRWTFAIRDCMVICLATDFTDCFQKIIVLFGRADAKSKILAQHWISTHIANENVAREQLSKNPFRIGGRFDEDEIRVRSHRREPIDLRQLRKESLSLRDDLADQRSQLALIIFHRDFRSDL